MRNKPVKLFIIMSNFGISLEIPSSPIGTFSNQREGSSQINANSKAQGSVQLTSFCESAHVEQSLNNLQISGCDKVMHQNNESSSTRCDCDSCLLDIGDEVEGQIKRTKQVSSDNFPFMLGLTIAALF